MYSSNPFLAVSFVGLLPTIGHHLFFSFFSHKYDETGRSEHSPVVHAMFSSDIVSSCWRHQLPCLLKKGEILQTAKIKAIRQRQHFIAPTTTQIWSTMQTSLRSSETSMRLKRALLARQMRIVGLSTGEILENMDWNLPGAEVIVIRSVMPKPSADHGRTYLAKIVPSLFAAAHLASADLPASFAPANAREIAFLSRKSLLAVAPPRYPTK